MRFEGLGDVVMSVPGKRVAVVGGDRRMEEAVLCLLEEGVDVRTAALPSDGRTMRSVACATAADAVHGARVLLLPVQGVDDAGRVYTQPGTAGCNLNEAALRQMETGGTVFTGIANQTLRCWCQQAGVHLVEYREADEFAIWNSIPSAEGAIQMAMEDSPFTLFGSRSLVIGFGRTGKAVALLLKGLNSDVTIAVRSELDFARVWAAGYRYSAMPELGRAVRTVDFIFNTAPSLVLTRSVLENVPPRAVVIDLASAPGGTDFAAAGELGVKARLAPGLPGIVAPATAGRIIALLILRHLQSGAGEEGGL